MVGQYREQLDVMMQREVSRADFLKFTGIAILGLIGIAGFFKNLNGLMPPKTNDNKSRGYGRSAYGR
ncbi:MAG TPA: hypothetical protein VIK37_00010 [Candidatus Saccharimonadales bacterium]